MYFQSNLLKCARCNDTNEILSNQTPVGTDFVILNRDVTVRACMSRFFGSGNVDKLIASCGLVTIPIIFICERR